MKTVAKLFRWSQSAALTSINLVAEFTAHDHGILVLQPIMGTAIREARLQESRNYSLFGVV
ncbi:hypothetical protein ACFL2Q_09760 [Thermodesulfobacteriota bacterium]